MVVPPIRAAWVRVRKEGRKEGGRDTENRRQKKRKERLIRGENNDSSVKHIDSVCPGDREKWSFLMDCSRFIIKSLLTSCVR